MSGLSSTKRSGKLTWVRVEEQKKPDEALRRIRELGSDTEPLKERQASSPGAWAKDSLWLVARRGALQYLGDGPRVFDTEQL